MTRGGETSVQLEVYRELSAGLTSARAVDLIKMRRLKTRSDGRDDVHEAFAFLVRLLVLPDEIIVAVN